MTSHESDPLLAGTGQGEPGLTALTIAEAGPLLASGRLSAVTLTTAFLERIRALEPLINAFVTVTDEVALRQAHAADLRLREGANTPLTGIPVAVKDSLETKGIKTTAGSIQLADNVPTQDAAVVERLDDGVLMGKLNLHEWQWGTSSANPFFGECRNPWDLERTPGGSSGGAGAALAADMCMGAIGSDTGGSIRIPASFCGVVGLKPTAGRVSLRGAVPLSPTLDTLGPMARSVGDVALMLGVIAGHDPEDPHSADRPVDDYVAGLAHGVEGWQVGVLPQAALEQCAPNVRAAIVAAAAVFERAGARLVEITVDLFDEGRALNRLIAAFETLQILRPRMALETNRFGTDIHQRLAEAQMIDEAAYVSALERRPHITRSFGALLGDCDILLAPATPIVAPLHNAPDARPTAPISHYLQLANLTGFPALSMPCGFSADGLPIGLQIIGRPWQEARILRAAYAYERLTPWHGRKPLLPGACASTLSDGALN